MTAETRRTETRRTEPGRPANRPTMRDVSHIPPYDDALTGGLLFSRGRRLATDGGERGPPTEATRSRPGRETMADVDHAPPDGDGAKRVWDRGLPKPGVHVAGEP